MRILVVTSEPISAEQLRGALPGDVEPQDLEVMVVAPALQPSPLKFWFADVDDAIARARETEEQTVEQLSQEGVGARGDTGESDPELAIEDALRTFSADQILLFTHAEQDQHYREDLDPAALERRLGVPVRQATVE